MGEGEGTSRWADVRKFKFNMEVALNKSESKQNHAQSAMVSMDLMTLSQNMKIRKKLVKTYVQ